MHRNILKPHLPFTLTHNTNIDSHIWHTSSMTDPFYLTFIPFPLLYTPSHFLSGIKNRIGTICQCVISSLNIQVTKRPKSPEFQLVSLLTIQWSTRTVFRANPKIGVRLVHTSIPAIRHYVELRQGSSVIC